MFTLGIPKKDYRRTTQVLGYESAEEIPYDAVLQDDGFYIFTFPEVRDEYDFRKIANKLKGEGIRIIGADDQLTERNIMKLADLIRPLHEEEEKGKKGDEAARKLIAKLREKTYRSFSDEDLDAFSKEMVLHLIDNPAAEAAIMMRNAKNKSLYSDDELDKTDNLPF